MGNLGKLPDLLQLYWEYVCGKPWEILYPHNFLRFDNCLEEQDIINSLIQSLPSLSCERFQSELSRVRDSASSVSFQYLLCSFMSFISCLGNLPRLPVPSILPSTFPSVMCLEVSSCANIVYKLPTLRSWSIQLILSILTLEDVTDRLSRNVGKELPLLAA